MATFEQVIHRVREKPLNERSEAELRELLIELRRVRTDVPETPTRRRKTKSLDHLSKKVEEVAKKLGKSADEVMAELLLDPNIAKAVKEDSDVGQEG